MRRLLWFGLLFLSTSWLFFMPIFTSSDYIKGFFILIIGIFFITFAFYKNHFEKIDKKYIIILIPLLIFNFIIPFPYNLGSIILTTGIIIYGIKIYLLKYEKTNWIPVGICLSGILIIFQTLLFPLYSIFACHNHKVEILSPIVSSLSNFLGLKTSANNGLVFVQGLQQIYPIATTWENLGFYPWFNIMIGALFLFFLLLKFKKIGIYCLGFFLLSSIYLLLRYIFMIFFYNQTANITIFWDPLILIISFIPFTLLLMRFAPFKNIHLKLDSFKIFKLNKNQTLAILMIFLFIFSLVGIFKFQDPGTPKQGRILIDELHSEWENSNKKIDKVWYGMLSTYNYYSWAEWLSKYYNIERNINNTLTLNLLNNYDILILKCPTNSYSEEEIKDIISFVDKGGGLYLIGDHTNVFGMNYYLNQISENFGIIFKMDATYELGTGLPSVYEPGKIFPHPIVQNIEQFDFLTSCTLDAPINSENIIIGNRLLSEPGTYSTENFFREQINSADIEYGLMLQVAAVKYGNGRVLAFTDSTCFSNFCIFIDGYTTFNLGAINYLNRINSYSYLNNLFFGLVIITFILTIFLLKKEKKTKILYIFLISGLLSFSIAVPVFSYINKVNYQLPVEHSDYTKICFEKEYSNIIIPNLPNFQIDKSNNLFGTFFVWTQRIDCVPSLEKTMNVAINKGDVVVIINPIKSFEKKEIEDIKDYIESGGKLLLMDSVINFRSTSNELLKSFNITIEREYLSQKLYNLDKVSLNSISNETTLYNDNMTNLTVGNISNPHFSITGGQKVYVTENNQTSIAVIEMGKGKIVVLVDSYTFNDNVMGGAFKEPDESLMQIYNLEYYIFEELLLLKNIKNT